MESALVSLAHRAPRFRHVSTRRGGVTAGAPIRKDGDFELSYLMSFSYVGAHSSGPVDREIVSGFRFSGAKFGSVWRVECVCLRGGELINLAS